MIEKYYASHIKDRLDAAAINIRKSKAVKKKGNNRKNMNMKKNRKTSRPD